MPDKNGTFIKRNAHWMFLALSVATFVVLISPKFFSFKVMEFFYPDIYPLPTYIVEQLDEVQASYRAGNNDVASNQLRQLEREASIREVDLTPLVGATITLKFTGPDMILGGVPLGINAFPVVQKHLKGVAVAIYCLFVVVLMMSIRLLTTTAVQPSKSRFEVPSSDTTVDDALSLEARNAWMAAHRFYGGSIYLLVSGVVMSFVGMAVFVVTFPAIVAGEASSSNGQWNWLPATIRGIGLLIFVEAVAWFLLRQYRSSTEDFKAFHRIYIRRSNYLVARKALSEIKSFEKSRKIAEVLLAEDLSSRLTAGQSTEAIEAMKVDESNPVFRILTDSLKQLNEQDKVKSPVKKEREDK